MRLTLLPYAAATSFFALASCATIEPGLPTVLSPEQVAAVHAGVREIMKDPDSAQFRGSLAASTGSDGIIQVCGWVNGKNSYGGYVGDRPFNGEFRGEKFLAGSIAGDVDEAKIMIDVCRRFGIEIT